MGEGHRRVQRLVRVALLLALVCSVVPPPAPAAAQAARARVVFDVPPHRAAPIGRVASGGAIEVEVPFHTTADVDEPRVTVWSRGVTVAPLALPAGPVPGFAPRLIRLRVGAPARIPPGPYPVSVQVADR